MLFLSLDNVSYVTSELIVTPSRNKLIFLVLFVFSIVFLMSSSVSEGNESSLSASISTISSL